MSHHNQRVHFDQVQRHNTVFTFENSKFILRKINNYY